MIRVDIVSGPARRIAVRTLVSSLAGAVVWTLYQLPSGKARIERLNAATGRCSIDTGRMSDVMAWSVPDSAVTSDSGWVRL